MTMNKFDKYVDDVINGFQNNRGKASVYCFKPFNPIIVAYNVINRFHVKNPQDEIFIVVDSYNTRVALLNHFKNCGCDLENDYKLKVLSTTYINTKYSYRYKLIITIGVNNDLNILKCLSRDSKFTLAIFTENIMNANFTMSIRTFLPFIDTSVTTMSAKQDLIYSPVEGHRVGVELSDDDRKLYDKCSVYINQCVSIFGDLGTIDKCKRGDTKLNISAAEIRHQIAINNGWSEILDTSQEFYKQLDDLYNPNNLYERACNFYNIAKQRRDLVSDNKAKLDEIARICLENEDKNILIVSKRGEFAAIVTKKLNGLNVHGNNQICGDYHDTINDEVARDIEGNIIYVKSGKNIGKPKIVGAIAISSQNEQRFNLGYINILSIKNASNPKLKIAIDMVIFTTPLCDDIFKLRSRFTNITFNNIPTKIYTIYCKNTIEQVTINKEKESPIYKIIDDTENNITYNENNGDIIL